MKTNTKKIFALIMSVIMIMGVVPAGILSASAASVVDSGTCGENLTWTLDSEGTLTISGTGEMDCYDFIDRPTPWKNYYDTIYEVIIEDGVTSIGNYAFYCCKSLSNVTIPDSVTCIDYRAFEGCLYLETVIFSENSQLKKIDDKAFEYCISLENFIIPDGVENIGDLVFVFTRLKEVIIPDSVISIGKMVFYDCPALEYVHIPSSVTEIGGLLCYNNAEDFKMMRPKFVDEMGVSEELVDEYLSIELADTYICSDTENCLAKEYAENYAEVHPGYDEYKIDFIMCSGHNTTDITEELVTSGTCGENLTWTLDSEGTLTISGTGEMGNYDADYKYPWYNYKSSISNIFIDSSVTSINRYAFMGCSNLTSVNFAQNSKLSYIGKQAFQRCSNLKNIMIPGGVIIIDDRAFGGCSSLENFSIPDSVINIGEGAFSNCLSLIDITIPSSVQSIGKFVFCNCESITSITVDKENLYFDSRNNCNAIIETKTNTLIQGCNKSTIPDGVTSIGYCAFDSCKGITNISIPDSVTSIDDCAFDICSSLESITIPDGVASIGKWTFRGCSSLKSITIPDSVTSIGDEAFNGCKNLLKIKIPDGVTNIGDFAFNECTSFTSVTIPDSVTSIGIYAFSGCTSLASITISDNVTNISDCTFYKCTSLKNITIPDSVTSIGEWAFGKCDNLTSIIIPDSIVTIGGAAFYECTSLEYIHIPSDVKEIGKEIIYKTNAYICSDIEDCYAKTYAEENDIEFVKCTGHSDTDMIETSGVCGDSLTWVLDDEGTLTISGTGDMYDYYYFDNSPWYGSRTSVKTVVIESGVTSVGEYAFCHCSSLESITIPDSVTIIGNTAFSGCTSLTSVTIPTNVTNIGDWSFSGCTELKNIVICNGVTHIGENAFAWCENLESIVIPDSVTYIGQYAFRDCSSLTSVIISNNLSTIENSLFSGCTGLTSITIPEGVTIIGRSAFHGCTGITSIAIPNSVTSIGKGAFEYCEKLTDVEIPNSVTSMEEQAFASCTNLTNITLSNNIKEIGRVTFYKCSNLTNFIIPDGVTSIGAGAFLGCSNLTDIIIPNSVTNIGEQAFYNCSSLEYVHIPSSVKEIEKNSLFNCSGAYICSDTANCYAKTYAEENNIEFVKCTGHVEKHNEKNDVTAVFDTNTFAEDVDLFVEKIKSEDKRFGSYKVNANDTQYGLFEIHMINSKDEYIQPQSGKVTLKMPIPAGIKASDYNSLYVVHRKQNKETEKFTYKNGEVRIEGKYLVFEIESFSTFAICKEAKDNSVSNITINVPSAKTIDYKSIVTIKAAATGVPSDCYLAIYVNGKQVAKGTNTEVIYKAGQVTSDINYTVKVVDANGNVQKDANGKDLAKDGGKITCNASFFKRIIAFFKGLFGMLPTVTIKP